MVHAYTMPVPRGPSPGCPRAQSGHVLGIHRDTLVRFATCQPRRCAFLWRASTMGPHAPNPLQSAPTPASFGGGGDWYMDTGASTHMASKPGNLPISFPTATTSHINVGCGPPFPLLIPPPLIFRLTSRHSFLIMSLFLHT